MLFFIIVQITHLSVNAQNEAYLGGSGKGDVLNKTNPVYLFGQPTDFYFGGNGKGDVSFSKTATFLYEGITAELFKGGEGRGDNNISTIQIYLNGENIQLPFLGSTGRGDEKSLNAAMFFDGTNIEVFFAGGEGRGDNSGFRNDLYMNNEEVNLPYHGGSGRGDYLSMVDLILLDGGSPNIFYSGGNGRGDFFEKRNLNSINDGPVTLNLNLFIEGFYLGGGSMQPVIDPLNSPLLCDPVTVKLHESSFPYSLAYNISEIIKTDGSGNYQLIPQVRNHSYYIVLKHRNALETWSSSPVLFNSSRIDFSFTESSAQAYGNNLKDLGDGNFALYSGDISDNATSIVGQQDGVIEGQDYSDMENAVYLVSTGYIPEDITGDGVVEGLDYSIMENNVYYVISVFRP